MLFYKNVVSLWVVVSYAAAAAHQKRSCSAGEALTCLLGGQIDGKDYKEFASPFVKPIEKGGFGPGGICWNRFMEKKCCPNEILSAPAVTDADGHKYITPEQADKCKSPGSRN
ncbi:hypothetical protein PTTG_26716 [Puccinia triticina 1-1 BBBD Race 1]|uniref:Uncharacterized protein n=2 Tax=Puccinia triticina TaxID=208348 RepID=A0A180GTM3_PUCT1|nr:uncharacterized protein PtA15_3A516 [Puccinia triticina]OAV95323.1 hypothetical protein PTTG_26716 [Puccinia triticina 1-1 BBBD Race 1]WAQ83149.1 hypothetical protein PtA15_3A516 [Puccinia triticina]WAR53988.1 hypothetical protein PtB15_3B498 [Puccinia triticina]